MSHIDHVATMDTPEEFGAFWLRLGRAAGFPVYNNQDGEVFNKHDQRADTPPELAPAQRATIAALNTCSQRISDLARRRSAGRDATTFATNVPGSTSVDRLVAWWGREGVSKLLASHPDFEWR